MKKQTITIYDVARESGVSMATVSRVVNGNDNVKPETKEKVLAVIENLNYHPNAVARGLASKKTTTIGVIIPSVTNLFFSALALGIDDIASMYDYNIILTNSDGNEEKELKVLETLRSKQVDGIIYMGNKITEDFRSMLNNMRTPMVLAGSIDHENKIPSVNIDYKQAVFTQTCELINNGNKKISFISGSLDWPINKNYRLAGYKQALKKFGIEYDESLVISTKQDYKSGYLLSSKIKNSNISAAVVSDDELAAGVLNGVVDSGMRVPEDFEVATSNDTMITEFTRPTMSTISQPLYDMGAVSMRLLTKLMNDDVVDDNNVLLNFSLKKRNSTK
ncbi:catabolite control protein A [Lactobacillus sp. S2-2]|uniref:catabolite control protein A n=1 Tax=Lactobacillus sp. S2-2 TaxID=2692917 RepID=UPI001F031B53|nr:catabolite control protein A [Lactobacillus sp. S2-2]MCF6515825.1 catabolite control protein A [Lactobacillus sp. S2-2]